jgi:hypothetical protein
VQSWLSNIQDVFVDASLNGDMLQRANSYLKEVMNELLEEPIGHLRWFSKQLTRCYVLKITFVGS